jgi:hypothetical protein
MTTEARKENEAKNLRRSTALFTIHPPRGRLTFTPSSEIGCVADEDPLISE